jgi:hypothetical protein
MSRSSFSMRAIGRVIGALVLAMLAACGGPPTTRLGVADESCRVLTAAGARADTVTVALLESIDPAYAPWGHNASEQLVFGHLYETLITVECDGKVRPGLAESWKREGDGRRWLFRLSRAARFWDGWRVTPRDVVRSWQDALTLGTVVDSAAVVGDRSVRVYLREPRRKVPRALAAPAFAVAGASLDSPWPVGTGRHRVAADGDGGGSGRRGLWLHPTLGASGPILCFLAAGGRDARDLLERRVDVLVTSDRAVIDYAASAPQWTAAPLPWNRTYLLLSTSRFAALRRGEAVGALDADLAAALARDAVRGDARGHAPPSWWNDLGGCAVPANAASWPAAASAGDSAPARRIAYDAADPVARDLAERLVALAGAPPATSPQAAAIAAAVPGIAGASSPVVAGGMSARALARSLRLGDDFAYIVSVPLATPIPCYEARALVRRAPWLAVGADVFAAALVPLVDTRAHVIVGNGGLELVADGYGHVRIAGGAPPEKGRR